MFVLSFLALIATAQSKPRNAPVATQPREETCLVVNWVQKPSDPDWISVEINEVKQMVLFSKGGGIQTTCWDYPVFDPSSNFTVIVLFESADPDSLTDSEVSWISVPGLIQEVDPDKAAYGPRHITQLPVWRTVGDTSTLESIPLELHFTFIRRSSP